jgi:hypothetical protein
MKRVLDRVVRLGGRGAAAVLGTAALAIAVGFVTGGWNAVVDLMLRTQPVAARVETDPVVLDSTLPYDWERYDYVIPAGPAGIPAPPPGMCRERFRWARELNGVDAYRTKIRVYLQGKSDDEVIIDGAKVTAERDEAPRSGTTLLAVWVGLCSIQSTSMSTWTVARSATGDSTNLSGRF